MSIIFSNPSIRLKVPFNCRHKTTTRSISVTARLDNSQQQEQQLNLSVLRFTFGLPGFDESYLPSYIGYGFGSLILLNHLVFANSVTSAQLRSEALGLALASFSVALPYLGKFLKGANIVEQKSRPENAEQIFVMSQDISDTVKEDLAWATYVLLRNTNTTSVLISVRDELCIRGYWSTPAGESKTRVREWFEEQIEKIGLSDLKDSLYFPQNADAEIKEILPQGTRSLFVQPVTQSPDSKTSEIQKTEGFVLLASSLSYAYSDKDRVWIRAIANKFRGKTLSMNMK